MTNKNTKRALFSVMPHTNIALMCAKEYGRDTKGSVFGADAFFHFEDAPKILSEAGCTSGTVPSGGKRHEQIFEFFKSKNVNVGFIPEQYRGFCRH